MFMKYINSFISKPANYLLIFAHFSNILFAQELNAETAGGTEAHFTLSGIDGSASYNETVCPGFTLCFDIFSFGGNQTHKADMHWDNGIPSAAFLVSNEDMPTGHFCWTPTQMDARSAPYSFHVTVKNATEEKVYTYQITVPLLRAEIRTTDISCYGNSDGATMAIVTGGSNSYSYQWSHQQAATSAVDGLGEGTVSVQVMDDYGCEATASARILSPMPLVLDAVSQHATCVSNSGQAEIIASGGTMPYSYSWLPGEGSSEKIDGLPSGVYTAVVTDANGCAAYKQVNISAVLPSDNSREQREMIAAESSVSSVLIYPNPTRNQFTVKNISGSTVTVTVVNSIGQNIYNTIHIPANLSAGISMDDQSNGIYLVKVAQQSTVETVRLVKE
jgi:hypothetical protein